MTPAEKALIEKQFMAKQAAIAKRRHAMESVFLIGLIAAVVGAFSYAFIGKTVTSHCLMTFWILSCGVYTGFAIWPLRFDKDIDPRWHLNPWQEALQKLGSEGRQLEGIVLLASFPLLRLVFLMVRSALLD
jgi:hypothetical protein